LEFDTTRAKKEKEPGPVEEMEVKARLSLLQIALEQLPKEIQPCDSQWFAGGFACSS
jgi:hypothetical protein